MEDSSDESEWEIQEGDYDKTSMVKWMLNNGYLIGKNMVIIGIVISSTPIVVPPLVVFSAMGYAFSVPFGLGFATYSCTNKIMSTLLPIPASPSPSPSPLVLEYYEQGKHQAPAKCRFGGRHIRHGVEKGKNIDGGGQVGDSVTNVDVDVDEERYYIDEEENEEDDFRVENVVEQEDNEQMEDLNRGVDIVCELDEGVESSHANENVNDIEMEINHVPQRENVVIEEEDNDLMEDIQQGVASVYELNEGGDDYGQQGEASIMNVDEETHHANENVDEKEMENVVVEEKEKEQMEDKKKGVDVVFNLDEGGGGDYGKQEEAPIMNVDENADERSSHANENVDDKEIKDHVPKRENVVVEGEEKEQMEDIKQVVENVFDLDEGGGDYKTQREVSILNVNENDDEGSNLANQNVDGKDVPQSENIVIEEEEKEQMEDIKKGVEMRLVLEEDQGYEEDVGEYLERDDDSFEDESKWEEPVIENQIEEHKSNTRDLTEDEKEDKVRGGDGLLENIRDESSINDTVDDDYFLDESAFTFEEVGDVNATEADMVKELDSQKLTKDGSKNDEIVGEMRHVVILAVGNEENNFNSREVEELDLVAREVIGDTNKKERNTESDEKVMRESMGTQDRTGTYTSNDRSEVAVLKTKKIYLIDTNEYERELGEESGLDERNTNINSASLEAGDKGKLNTADENVDYVGLPAFKRAPLAADNGKAAKTKTNTKVPSREHILDEERIWEKIGAMRTIVGYKTPSQPTCIGELKALYVFTGVEPPASFKDDSDLDEVNAKIKFLMSIVGVK